MTSQATTEKGTDAPTLEEQLDMLRADFNDCNADRKRWRT